MSKPLVEPKNFALRLSSTMIGLCHGLFDFDPGPPGGTHDPPGGQKGKKQDFTKSKIVANKSCQVHSELP